MADPDLQIREGPGHPDHEIRRGGGGCPKKFFQSFVQQFSVTIRGGGGPGPSPGSTTGFTIIICITLKLDRQRVQMATDFSAK